MNRRSTLSLPRAVIAVVLSAMALPGCASFPWAPVPLDATAGFYNEATLTYRVDAGALQQPLDVLRVQHQQVTYEQVASSPSPGQTIGTLTVTYPHPAGRSGLAQARFTIESGKPEPEPKAPSRWNPFSKKKTSNPIQSVASSGAGVHESWVLDISSAESDQLFKLLASQGFYQTNRMSAVGVKLSATINGREVHKDWEQVPQFDALIQRIRRDGQLVAYRRSSGTAGGSQPALASTRAYSDMIAHLGSPGVPTTPTGTPAGSPFAMPAAAGPPMMPPGAVGVANVPNVVR